MKGKTRQPALGLSAGELADLAAVAVASKCSVSELAAEVIRLFLYSNLRPARHPRDVEAARLEVAAGRMAMLKDWRKARSKDARRGIPETDTTRAFIVRLRLKGIVGISRSTLFGWERRWQGDGGLYGLIDRRSTRVQTAPETPFLAEVLRRYSLKNCRSLTTCIREATKLAASKKWKTHSYSAVHRFISKNISDFTRKRRGN